MHAEQRGFPRRLVGGLTAAVVLAATACAHRTVTPSDLIRFTPPPDGFELVYTTALLAGRLQYRNGCFRVIPPHQTGSGVLVIWPHDYVAVQRDGRQGVMDPDGRTVFDGEQVRLGGGAVDELHAGILGRERAGECGGPYSGAYIQY